MARRRVQGFTDLGGIRIPPLAVTIVFTDRGTGTLYALIHDVTGNFIGIDDETAQVTRPDAVVFGAFAGPLLSKEKPILRLLVRDGVLGFEEVVLPTGVSDLDQARVLSRRINESMLIEIRKQ